MARFGIQQFRLNNILYPGAKGYQLDRGLEVVSEGSDGTLFETTHHVVKRKPIAEITTLALKTILAALNGGTDLPVLQLNGTNGLILYGARQAANAVGYAGGSVHESRTGLLGVVYMSGLRWSLGRPAELMLRALFISPDGTTLAIVPSSVAALPAQPTPDFGFTLQALTINGSSILGVNSLEIGIDPHFDFDHTAGLPEPTSINGAGSNGKLAITMRADVGDLDLGEGAGAVSAVFKRYGIGGGLASDTATFTLNSNFTSEDGFGGDNGSPMARALMVRTRYDGTNKPLTWALG